MPYKDINKRKEYHRVYMKKYMATEKGKEHSRKHTASDSYKKYQKEYTDSGRRKKYLQEYRKTDKAKLASYKYTQSIWGKYKNYKSCSKRRGIDFLLTKEEFLLFWNKPCYYCNSEINTIGLDRVDSDKGYEISNIVPCCSRCNMAKSDMNILKYIEHCAKVIHNFKMSRN